MIGVEWERALSRLKNATRTAEDDGGRGLYQSLLGNPAARPKRAPKKSAPTTPADAKS